MSKSILFPVPMRQFAGQRWLRISLRTWHLMSMAFLVGGTAAGLPFAEQPVAMWGTVLSGALFIAVELYASCIFLAQLKGVAVLVKILLLWAALISRDNGLSYLLASIVIGGISSHMPGRFRYYSLFHGRVVKE
jgi:hypothetical protein